MVPKLVTAAKLPKGEVYVDGDIIFIGDTEVGQFIADRPVRSKRLDLVDNIKDPDEDSLRILTALDHLKVPDSFPFVWIDRIRVDLRFRGQGVGGLALTAFIKSVRAPCLVGLQPGMLSPGQKVSFEKLKVFYIKAGFVLVALKKETLAYYFKR